jgi:hypothetical protein
MLTYTYLNTFCGFVQRQINKVVVANHKDALVVVVGDFAFAFACDVVAAVVVVVAAVAAVVVVA